MKKALVALLLLAIMAGGLFAQGFNFSGYVNSGFAWAKLDGAEENVFGLNARNWGGGSGFASRLDITADNEDKTAGIFLRIQATGQPGATWNNNSFVRRAWIYAKFLDNMMEITGGRVANSRYYNSFDDISDWEVSNYFGVHGMMLNVFPTDMFTFGVGAFSGTGTSGTGQGFNEGNNVDAMHGWVGLAVKMPDLFELRAQARGGGGANNNTQALASLRVRAVPGFDIMATGWMYDIQNFSDTGAMIFSEQVGITVIDNLGINVALMQAFNQREDTDMVFRGWFWLTYRMGDITPRFDANYYMGRGFNLTGIALHPAEIGSNFPPLAAPKSEGWNSDLSFITLSPSLAIRLTRQATFELGYLFAMDMSKDGLNAIRGGNGQSAYDPTKNGSINHAAFIDFRATL